MALLSFEHLSDQQTSLRFQEAVAKIYEFATKNLNLFQFVSACFSHEDKRQSFKAAVPSLLGNVHRFIALLRTFNFFLLPEQMNCQSHTTCLHSFFFVLTSFPHLNYEVSQTNWRRICNAWFPHSGKSLFHGFGLVFSHCEQNSLSVSRDPWRKTCGYLPAARATFLSESVLSKEFRIGAPGNSFLKS